MGVNRIHHKAARFFMQIVPELSNFYQQSRRWIGFARKPGMDNSTPAPFGFGQQP